MLEVYFLKLTLGDSSSQTDIHNKNQVVVVQDLVQTRFHSLQIHSEGTLSFCTCIENQVKNYHDKYLYKSDENFKCTCSYSNVHLRLSNLESASSRGKTAMLSPGYLRIYFFFLEGF